MKKMFLSFLMICYFGLSFAQEITKEPVSQSRSVEFLSNNGLFILKEWYDLGKLKGIELVKGVSFAMDCKVLIITNLKDNTKIGCLKLNTSDTDEGTIDADELDECIQSLRYLSNSFLSTIPSVYTEVEYITRDFVKIGAFYNDEVSKWNVFVYTTLSSNSAFYLSPSEIANLISVFERAKYVIKDKTSK